jgi:hypothetical protein
VSAASTDDVAILAKGKMRTQISSRATRTYVLASPSASTRPEQLGRSWLGESEHETERVREAKTGGEKAELRAALHASRIL